MDRDDDKTLDGDELTTTEPQLHRWDGEDPDGDTVNLENVTPLRPRSSDPSPQQ